MLGAAWQPLRILHRISYIDPTTLNLVSRMSTGISPDGCFRVPADSLSAKMREAEDVEEDVVRNGTKEYLASG